MTGYSTVSSAKSACRWHFRRAVALVRLAAVLVILPLFVLYGPLQTAQATEPVIDHIPLTEITKGMTGYGLTVFSGSVIDTFGVTVIGVQEKARAAGSFLLIEVSGHDLELTSIAQGMSGSPIYLDGRFAGALAFGWGGSLRPIAGVTPAADMLALPTGIPEVARRQELSSSLNLAGLIPLGSDTADLAAGLWGTTGLPTPTVVPLSETNGWLDAPSMWLELTKQLAVAHPELDTGPDQWLFQPLGLAGGRNLGGEQSGEASPRLVPGAACAVPMVTGDASLGAIGTVTWVDGDQVLMMGHPFMHRGPVDFPLATAEILTILPSRQMSFKMGSVGQIIGTVHHDLRAGLSGRMGAAPQMIPVSVAIKGNEATELQYRFEILDDPFLTPTLAYWAIYNALLVTADDASLQTMRYRVETRWSGLAVAGDETVVISGVTAGPGSAAGLAGEVMGPLSILLNNPHAEVHLESVSATLESARPLQTATVVSLTSPRSVLQPGQQVEFQAEIEPRRGKREMLSFPVTIPAHLPPGPYRVVLASAADLFALEAQRAAGRFQPVNLNGILNILRSSRGRDTLVLALMAPGQSTILHGQEMNNLPKSVARTVRAGNMQAQRTMADYAWRSEKQTPWLLTGHAVRSLRIQPAVDPVTEERRP